MKGAQYLQLQPGDHVMTFNLNNEENIKLAEMWRKERMYI